MQNELAGGPQSLAARAWQSAFDLQLVLDESGQILDVNEAVRAGLGYEPDTLLGRSAFEFVHPDERERAANELADFCAHPDTMRPITVRLLPQTGEVVPYEFTAHLFNHAGARYVALTARDRRAQQWGERLRVAEARIRDAALHARSMDEFGPLLHRVLSDLIPAPHCYIAAYDESRSLIQFPYWADGYDPKPVVKQAGHGLTEYVLRTQRTLLANTEKMETLRRSGEAEVQGRKPQFWLGAPLLQRGRPMGLIALQSYEGDPPLNEEHRMALHNLAPVIATALMARGQLDDSNRDALLSAIASAAELFLKDPDWTRQIDSLLEGLGRAADASRACLFEVTSAPAGRTLCSQRFGWVAEGIESQLHNPLLQSCDLVEHGLSRWVEHMRKGEAICGPISQFPDQEQHLLRALGIHSTYCFPIMVNDCWWGFIGLDDCLAPREWSMAEKEALRLAAQILGQAIRRTQDEDRSRVQRTALSAAASGIVITDIDGRILWVNQAFSEMTGYSLDEVIGKNPRLLKSGVQTVAFYQNLWDTVLAGRVWRGELVNRRKNGGHYTEEMTITPVRDASERVTHFIAIKQDITEKKFSQQQLLHAQKMESIGRLAGGIAHDFNNLLQAITGFSAILLSEMADGDPRRLDVQEIDRAAQRAASLTRQLLSFGRQQKLEVAPVQLNDVVNASVRLLQRLLGENIQLHIELDPQLGPVRADPGQIEQVIVNLSINARDAMPDGGRLTIATRAVDLKSGEVPPVTGARPGRFACLEVHDTGVGMPPEILSKVFEPFFTTKEGGKGTGLGLSVVYGIVRQHEGFTDVQSQPGAGSCFRVFLPFDPKATEPAPPAEAAPVNARLKGTGQHILVLEDEEGVRELTCRILGAHGYRVSAARTVAQARALLDAPSAPFDLLFSDIVLPDGNGLDFAEACRAQHPDIKIILTSGYTQDQPRWAERLAKLDGFLSKPYPPPTLLRLLQGVLQSDPKRAP